MKINEVLHEDVPDFLFVFVCSFLLCVYIVCYVNCVHNAHMSCLGCTRCACAYTRRHHFICCLFDSAVTGLVYVVSSGRMISAQQSGGEKLSWINFKCPHIICLKGLRAMMTIGSLAEN
jgi:hypothetical protein